MAFGYIYLITNKINKKQYVGQTGISIEERWRKHIDNSKNCPNKQIITMAIAKYGQENFSIEELAKCPLEDTIKNISERVGLSTKTVSSLMKKYGIEIKNHRPNEMSGIISHMGKHTDNLVHPCPVRIRELGLSFSSLLECARYFIDMGYTKTNNEINVMKSISRAMSANDYGRSSYLGFHIEKI